MLEITSTTAQRFLRNFTHSLIRSHRVQMVPRSYSRDHPITSRHEVAGIELYLLWSGEQKWTLRTDRWSIRSNMISFQVSGDTDACEHDLTLIMMFSEIEE